MALKDYFAGDLDVFMSLDEFADIHEVNGQKIPVVLDEDILKTRSSYRDVPMDGVYTGRKVIFIKTASLGKAPAIGSISRIDGKLFLVVEVSEARGVLEITVEANET